MSAGRPAIAALALALGAGCEEDAEAVHFTVLARGPAYIAMRDAGAGLGYDRYIDETAREARRWCARHDADERFDGVDRDAYWTVHYTCVTKIKRQNEE